MKRLSRDDAEHTIKMLNREAAAFDRGGDIAHADDVDRDEPEPLERFDDLVSGDVPSETAIDAKR